MILMGSLGACGYAVWENRICFKGSTPPFSFCNWLALYSRSTKHWPVNMGINISQIFTLCKYVPEFHVIVTPTFPYMGAPLLSQHKYASTIIHCAALFDTKYVATPSELNVKLRSTDGEPLPHPTHYKENWLVAWFISPSHAQISLSWYI